MSEDSKQPVTVVISAMVRPSRVQDYEEWQQGINNASAKFDGYLGVDIIRPSHHTHPEYVTILRFADYEALRAWEQSEERGEWLKKAEGMLLAKSWVAKPSGLQVWFNRPDFEGHLPRPAYYKLVIVGMLAVYPLILLVDTAISPFTAGWPHLLRLLLSVTFVSALLTYPVMPTLTRLLDGWLYPHQPDDD
ncbi:MAG: antibiotic biosynthesis monooxygenase [Chloroflexi bacterium]|nr:MAG: antibiotic biosynthesis monooxygenase [Chloroflexota bacterium]MBL1197227.1 antibiotic biosynthesis monooxygenase [Chloroflexota bacterium]NOH14521.1 antibiotic biosynthesis monooxygenase [Chloroflexota bacterium]